MIPTSLRQFPAAGWTLVLAAPVKTTGRPVRPNMHTHPRDAGRRHDDQMKTLARDLVEVTNPPPASLQSLIPACQRCRHPPGPPGPASFLPPDIFLDIFPLASTRSWHKTPRQHMPLIITNIGFELWFQSPRHVFPPFMVEQ
jgi:hypothetical protein